MQRHFDRRPNAKIRILPYGPLHAAIGLISREESNSQASLSKRVVHRTPTQKASQKRLKRLNSSTTAESPSLSAHSRL